MLNISRRKKHIFKVSLMRKKEYHIFVSMKATTTTTTKSFVFANVL